MLARLEREMLNRAAWVGGNGRGAGEAAGLRLRCKGGCEMGEVWA